MLNRRRDGGIILIVYSVSTEIRMGWVMGFGLLIVNQFSLFSQSEGRNRVGRGLPCN